MIDWQKLAGYEKAWGKWRNIFTRNGMYSQTEEYVEKSGYNLVIRFVSTGELVPDEMLHGLLLAFLRAEGLIVEIHYNAPYYVPVIVQWYEDTIKSLEGSMLYDLAFAAAIENSFEILNERK